MILSIDHLITFADAKSIKNRNNMSLDIHRVEVEAKNMLKIVVCTASSREVKDCYNKSNLFK
jgi:hypothetical protein